MAGNTVMIRCDSSRDMGIGHVSRCGALAGEMQRGGLDPVFLCRQLPGDQRDLLRARGFETLTLADVDVTDEEDADRLAQVSSRRDAGWILLDHPRLGLRYETAVRANCNAPLAVIDGQFREHDCDLLLNPNVYATNENCAATVPGDCRVLAGYDYFLLREAFREPADTVAPAAGARPRVLVTLGGSDPDNLTPRICRALAALDLDCAFDVMQGPANRHGAALAETLEAMGDDRFTLHREAGGLAALLAGCTLCVSAGGITLGEAAYLGKPVIALVIAENQRRTVDTLAARGAVLAGDEKSVGELVAGLLANHARRRQLAAALDGLVDGRGAGRVVAALLERRPERPSH